MADDGKGPDGPDYEKTGVIHIDGVQHQVRDGEVTGALLLALVAKDIEDFEITRLGDDEVLDIEVVIDLGRGGHFATRPASKPITVFLNTVPHSIARGVYTTETLIAALKDVPSGHVLDIIEKVNGQPVFRELKQGEPIKPKKGDQFVSHVPTGGSA